MSRRRNVRGSGRNVTMDDVRRWKASKREQLRQLDQAQVFLRGVDAQLEDLERRREAILAQVPRMRTQRDTARLKIDYYDKHIKAFARTAKLRERLHKEQVALRSMESMERERLYGR